MIVKAVLKKTYFVPVKIYLYVRLKARKSVTNTGKSWWRNQMETFSALLAICAGNSTLTGRFPAQRPVTRSFDVFFGLRLNKRLSKQSWSRWFEALSSPLWRHCNDSSQLHYNNNLARWPHKWMQVCLFVFCITGTREFFCIIDPLYGEGNGFAFTGCRRENWSSITSSVDFKHNSLCRP